MSSCRTRLRPHNSSEFCIRRLKMSEANWTLSDMLRCRRSALVRARFSRHPLLVTALLIFAGLAQASVIDFESLPDANFFSAGDQNIGSYYSGITFGPVVTALSISRFGGYDNLAYPPHSGDVVVWDASDPTITILFSKAQTSFGVWYTSLDPLTMQLFGSSNNLLVTVTGLPNTDGTIGTSSFLSFAGSGIQSVQLTSAPSLFVLDDVTYQPVPEPAAVWLITVGLTFVLGRTALRLRT